MSEKINIDSWKYFSENKHMNVRDLFLKKENISKVIPDYLLKLIPSSQSSLGLHICCGDGLETNAISLTLDQELHGIDFLEKSIIHAKQISNILGSKTDFFVCEFNEFLETCPKYDFIFTTLGTLKWIQDIEDFFAKVYLKIKNGGSVIIWDFVDNIDQYNQKGLLMENAKFHGNRKRHSGVSNYKERSPFYKKEVTMENMYKNDNPVFINYWKEDQLLQSLRRSRFELISFNKYDHIYGEKYYEWMHDLPEYKFGYKDNKNRKHYFSITVEAQKLF